MVLNDWHGISPARSAGQLWQGGKAVPSRDLNRVGSTMGHQVLKRSSQQRRLQGAAGRCESTRRWHTTPPQVPAASQYIDQRAAPTQAEATPALASQPAGRRKKAIHDNPPRGSPLSLIKLVLLAGFTPAQRRFTAGLGSAIRWSGPAKRLMMNRHMPAIICGGVRAAKSISSTVLYHQAVFRPPNGMRASGKRQTAGSEPFGRQTHAQG